MKYIHENEQTEGLLLIDVDNAFDDLNRPSVHIIKQLCPKLHRYFVNTYQLPVRIIINNQNSRDDDI